MTIELSNVRKKNKGTTECDKSPITCNVDTTQYEDEAMKNEKKKNELLNMTKVLSNVMLILPNMTIEPSNVRKNIRELSNIAKKQSHVMLELYNVMMEPSNMRKK